MKRKSPRKHRVKKHEREDAIVKSHSRGSGTTRRVSVRSRVKIPDDRIFFSFYEVEQALVDGDIPTYELIRVRVKGEDYWVIGEEWWDGCLESRGFDETTKDLVAENYLEIMKDQSGFVNVARHNYLRDQVAQYGLTYIIKKI